MSQTYTVTGLPEEGQMLVSLSRLSTEHILVFKSIWPSDLEDDYRYLFEVVLPEAAKCLDLPDNWTYSQVMESTVIYFLVRCMRNKTETYNWANMKEKFLSEMKAYKKEQPYEIALDMLLKLMI